MLWLPPTSTLFPYTTLFRSEAGMSGERLDGEVHVLLDLRRVFERVRARDPHALVQRDPDAVRELLQRDRKSTRLNSSHLGISYAVFCLIKKTATTAPPLSTR